MSDLDLINDFHRRCLHLLGERTSVTIKDVKIEHHGDWITASIVSPPRTDKDGDTWRKLVTIYDTRSPVQDQLLSAIRGYVMPLLQRHMILDDLADV